MEPSYKMLLYPYRTGDKLPETTWDATRTKLTIKLPDGKVDTMIFDRSNPDHRTRITLK